MDRLYVQQLRQAVHEAKGTAGADLVVRARNRQEKGTRFTPSGRAAHAF
jgi:hypothetical protein